MFHHILIPISSEYYSKQVLERSAFIADKFQSDITLVYIIEKKTLDKTDKRINGFRTSYDIDETKREIIREQKKTADTLIFANAKQFFKNRNIPVTYEIAEGEFSTVVRSRLNRDAFDLILMGFEKECLLHYRLFNDVNIPIWIESGYEPTSILAICSNLAPNQKVPEISLELSKKLGWSLDMMYVVDIQDTVVVDALGRRSERKPENSLISEGEQFVTQMNRQGIDTHLLRGSLEKETIRAAEKSGETLVILGREQKKKRVLGVPMKSVKKKIAEKCRYSLLFMN
jgi:nucleotide-binding universal stress UspA family protein